MSIEAKIEQVIEIWIDKGSLSPTAQSKNKKYDEIMCKILDGTYKESDLDLFIDRSTNGFYEKEREEKKEKL